MITKSIKLHFHTPLHIGSGKDELDKSSLVYHSDALKSALYAVGLPYFTDWQQPNIFFNTFKMSSCFPFYKDGLFLPKPLLKVIMKFRNTNEDKIAKKAKKITFLSETVLRKWSENPGDELLIDEDTISADGAFIFSDKNKTHAVYRNEVHQRVQVPLESEEQDSKPYYVDRIYFEPDAGLYFIVQFDNDRIQNQVLQTLHLLGDMGIGTDRTVGNGLFSFNEKSDVQSFDMPGTSKLNKKIPLGLYLPKKEEIRKINLDNSSWQLIKRGGYIAGTPFEEFMSLRKNNIYFFAEGSVFDTKEELTGRFENLRPEWNNENLHPVWRDGQPIFMNL